MGGRQVGEGAMGRGGIGRAHFGEAAVGKVQMGGRKVGWGEGSGLQGATLAELLGEGCEWKNGRMGWQWGS